MGRPIREDMSYFSHDSDARRDRKAKLFIAHTGLTGWGFFWAVLEDIYNNSYYLPWSEEDQHLYVAEFSNSHFTISFEDVSYILDQACKWGLLNAELFHNNSILTSASVQRRWLKQASRRVLAEMREDYVLISLEEFYKKELKTSNLSIKVVDKNGDTVKIYGDYTEETGSAEVSVDTNEDNVNNNVDNSKTYDSKYDFECEDKWDTDQPIDYAGCVEVWNGITGANSRITPSKRTDLRRVFRNYTGIECYRAMIVRSKDEKMKDSKYLTDWSTLFGAKKLENLDKWVGRGREWMEKQQKMETPGDYLSNGWFTQKQAQKLSQKAGVEFEDPMFWDTKKVESQLLYYPKFSY